ncbi:glycoside hydrolase family 18 protein [Symbiobacterium thermophilum]|uniref:Spore gernimation protein n=1 Tax=Symbiobacterium thermophilum TaxID=2734 RepID=A0A953I9Y2_SYMTR|nr:glycoside hydrolase family 18 protein [Symbiobacterium thermophilum]MBY6276326.1 spore gernimation protein [Symbiobacterium thermophilum]
MQIHVVEPGQSLYAIARMYSVTPESIAQANQLNGLPYLVVGQALVIPITGRYYWVQPGDSLWSIGQRFGLDPSELARINGIPTGAMLPVGLRLYIPPAPRPRTEVNAYVEPFGESVSAGLVAASREAAPHLTYLAPFSFRVQRDGTLQAPPLDDLLEIARDAGAVPMLVVTNLEEGGFSDELGRIILNDQAVQDRLLGEIRRLIREMGFRDVHFDFEFLRPQDRQAYNRFLRRAADLIHGEGALISTALAPKASAEQTGQWYEAHDYAAHGQTADFVVLMTYEWGYSGGPPMAVSPIDQVRRVLAFAVTQIPREKIMMGQNLYGYDWTLPYRPGGEYARAISPQEAIRQAARRGAAIEFDTRAQAPFYRYVDEQGRTHEVWFEDARSIQAKFNLLKELGLRGISYWKLGLDFPQNWLLLEDNFTVAKRAG